VLFEEGLFLCVGRSSAEVGKGRCTTSQIGGSSPRTPQVMEQPAIEASGGLDDFERQ